MDRKVKAQSQHGQAFIDVTSKESINLEIKLAMLGDAHANIEQEFERPTT